MGFRSTLTTESLGITWPQWFRDKYASSIQFTPDGTGPLHSKCELKTYGVWLDLHTDIQRAIEWTGNMRSLVMVYLHECGGITRCQIERDTITWSEPDGWRVTEGVEHDYCYGCSDVGSTKERAALSAPAVPEAVLAERKRLANRLRYETELEGFGCACSPLRQCATCNAREVLRKVLAPLIGELDAAPQPQEQPCPKN